MVLKRLLAVAVLVVLSSGFLAAGDLKITIPRRSNFTPVQKLNREGVEAIRKHNYERAEAAFYKAYLVDPDDPFTLNNLGYISELQGQVDRARRFYELAAQQTTDAVIAEASSARLRGRPLRDALAASDVPLQTNHDNVEAVRLLSQGRAPEADMMLQEALKRDPQNVFTLNNLGVAKEMEGETQEALRYYDAASASASDAAAVVTLDRSWRGKPVNQMAAENARALRSRLERNNTQEARVAELNLRGVSAINRNDLMAADQDFRKAYAMDPNNAFAINNLGFVSEIAGDRESAQFFYQSAQRAVGAEQKVGLASRRTAEGQVLARVAEDNTTKVDTRLAQERDARRSQHEPIVLRRRDNSVVQEPASPSQTNGPEHQPQ